MVILSIVYPIMCLCRSRREKAECERAKSHPAVTIGAPVDEESSEEEVNVDLEASKSKVPKESVTPVPSCHSNESIIPTLLVKSPVAQVATRLVKKMNTGLGLDEDLHAPEKDKLLREFSFRAGQKKCDDESVPDKSGASGAAKEAETYFVTLLCLSAFSVCVAHGGNDVGNATGPLSAILGVFMDGTLAKTPDIPMWATIYGCLGFAVGILTMGRFTIKTVGTKITVLSPSTAFCTQIGGAVAVLSASALGMPVSTSHCLVGAVVGIGLAQKATNTGKLNFKVLSKIFIAWIVTIPLAMLVTLVVFLPFKHLFA